MLYCVDFARLMKKRDLEPDSGGKNFLKNFPENFHEMQFWFLDMYQLPVFLHFKKI